MICIIITCVSNFSFAAEPVDMNAYCATSSICGTAPKDFTLLLSFVREMMNAIKTIGTQWDYVGAYVSPNRFKWNVFAPPAQTVASKLERNVEQKLKFGLASTAIFANPVNFAGLKDIAGGTVLLSKNQAFLRDAKLVETLESQLTDKKYELWLWGWRYEKINAENLKIMQSIIKKYVDAGLLSASSAVENGTLYNNITFVLTQMLSAAKSFLYFGSLSPLSEIAGDENTIHVVLQTGPLQAIERDYACARWPYYICSSELKDFKGKISAITSSFSQGAASAKKTFLDAVKRLWQLFSKDQEKDFTARETELLKTMYGTTQDKKWIFAGSIKQSLSTIAADVSDVWSDVSRFRTPSKNTKDIHNDIISAKDAQNIMSDTVPSAWEPTFEEYLKSYVQDVFNQQSTDIELASFAEVKDVTPAFNVLWRQIATIKNNILGGKDQDGSLIKSLWAACELQCGRGGLCR